MPNGPGDKKIHTENIGPLLLYVLAGSGICVDLKSFETFQAASISRTADPESESGNGTHG